MPKVLVVDDTESARNVLSRLLRSDGFDTSMACNGAEAIAMVDPPDLIMLDLNKPEIDGIAVLQWLRSHPEHKAVAVVILSAASMKEMDRARSLGARTCLRKASVSWPEIQREVHQHISDC